MGDAPLEYRLAGIVVIQMHRVAVGRDLREKFDIHIGHDFAQMARHADFDIFDADPGAGILSNMTALW